MNRGLFIYAACWSALCIVALAVGVLRRRVLAIASASYWRFLLRPWKVAVFALAAGGLTAMAPWSGDPTWDHVDAAMMSILAFAVGPWAVGVLWRGARGWQRPLEVALAVVAW